MVLLQFIRERESQFINITFIKTYLQVEFEEPLVMEERRINVAIAEEESDPSVHEPQSNQLHEDSATSVSCNANVTAALTDDEHIDSLDFEEISDDELEEEAKVNKGHLFNFL